MKDGQRNGFGAIKADKLTHTNLRRSSTYFAFFFWMAFLANLILFARFPYSGLSSEAYFLS